MLKRYTMCLRDVSECFRIMTEGRDTMGRNKYCLELSYFKADKKVVIKIFQWEGML